MTSKEKIRKALKLVEDVLLEGDLQDDFNKLEEVVDNLEEVLKDNDGRKRNV